MSTNLLIDIGMVLYRITATKVNNYLMRICYFADGRSIHTSRWIKFFSQIGHEMHLISFAEVPPEKIEELRGLGVKYHGATGNFHLKKFWVTLKDLRFVKRVLRDEKIDLLHSHFLASNTWFAALSAFHPHVISVMGGDVTGENWTPSGSLQERLLTPYALRNADLVSTWGPVLARRIKPYVREGKTIEIVHGGVDLKQFKPGPKLAPLRERLNLPEGSRVVFSPRLIRRLYNIDTIAHAAGLVCEQRSDTYFVIALPSVILDTEYVEQVKEIIANNAAGDFTRFVPTISHVEIADYFRLADVTVSIPDTDGLGLAILESMACGTPTVIGNLPDYDREFFEHEKTTLMTDVKNPESVANAILRFLSEEDLSREVTAEARRRVEGTGGYEFQMMKMEEIYQRLAAG
jgi:L-malate glycosyltransferase